MEARAERAGTLHLGECTLHVWLSAAEFWWDGQVAGSLLLEGGGRRQEIVSISCAVHCGSSQGGWVFDDPSCKLGPITIGSRERVTHGFHIPIRWGKSAFGMTAGLRLQASIPGSSLQWPYTLQLPLEMLPPPRFMEAGRLLAEIADAEQGVWKPVGDGDGAAVELAPLKPGGRYEKLRLTLFRGGGSLYGDIRGVQTGPLGGLLPGHTRTAALRLTKPDPAAVRIALEAAYSSLHDDKTLPIPSCPRGDDKNLPRASSE